MKAVPILIGTAVLLVTGAAIFMMSGRQSDSRNSTGRDLPLEGRMPSLDPKGAWLNSPPLADSDLRGKVVLVEFWTYSCINWRRQLPYVRAWAEKYKDKGLIVIGVHTPEFEFEKHIDRVRVAAKDFNVGFPIALDPEYSIWSSFNNHYWPALYFVDAQGNIRHHQFGEGKYDESEKIIQQLLKESGAVDIDDQTVSVDARGEEAPADWDDLGSPENYVGFDRTENFASHGGTVLDAARVYEFPSTLELNQWALSGEWTFERETLAMRKFGGKLSYRFHARDLHIVMGPGKSESPIRFRILIDGKPPGDAHGIDVDADGNGTIVEPRMYQLIRQPKPISDRVLEIEFLDPGAELFSFTFG